MSSTTDNGPEGFVALGKGIYIKKSSAGQAPASSSTEGSPSIILIFSWMSAAMPHLMKYTKAYEDLYPSATQILVQSSPSYFFRSKSSMRANMMPLVEALEAMGCIEPEKSGEPIERDPKPLRILTHCFSNGGAFNLSTLHRVIISKHLVARRQVVSALVLDSLPGRTSHENVIRAFGGSSKNPAVNLFISAFMLAYYSIMWIRGQTVDGSPFFFVDMEEDLNTEELLGWMDKKTPRLYLFSEKDELIAPDDVYQHAGKATAKGFNVKLEKFSESKHVSHARVYPERYWGEVKAVWERSAL